MTYVIKSDIQNIFSNLHSSPQLFNISQPEITKLTDIAIIQAFYGLDPDRISATSNSLKTLLKSTTLPEDYIFIEAQENEDMCCFKWLKSFGIKHIFIKISSEQNNLFLKTPLWNIGVKNTKASRLCFIDSDIMFCDSNWLKSVNDKFDQGYNVMSLHGYSYYENSSEESEFLKSIGLRHAELNYNGKNDAHYGFTLGLTRDIFNKIHGFNCTLILDDLDYWINILGSGYLEKQKEWEVFENNARGIFNAKLGSTEEVICHCEHNHNPKKYKVITDIVKNKIYSYSDIIEYDKTNIDILPKWRSNSNISKIINNAIIRSHNEDLPGNLLYFEEAEKIFGKISDSNPLYVYTVFKKSFKNNDYSINTFAEKISECLDFNNFEVFSDIESGKYLKIDHEFDIDFMHIFENNNIPDNTNVLFIPFECKKLSRMKICNCEENDIAFDKSTGIIYFKYSRRFADIMKKCNIIGRNTDEFLYFNGIKFNSLSKYILKDI